MLVRKLMLLSLTVTLPVILSAGCSGQFSTSANQPELASVIFEAEQIPWEEMENGWRRKVLFSGQLTFVVLEAKGPTSGPIELHSHVHDQISYVMEGDVEVHIGDETKRISHVLKLPLFTSKQKADGVTHISQGGASY